MREGPRRFEIPLADEVTVHRRGARLRCCIAALQAVGDPSTGRPFADTLGAPRALPRGRASKPGPADGFGVRSLTNT